MIDLREEEILAKIDRDEKICATCKFFMEFRSSLQKSAFGTNAGWCEYDGIANNRIYLKDNKGRIVVLADSTCDRYQSIYRE